MQRTPLHTFHGKHNSITPFTAKNYALRRHGNLTTFDGLIEFRRMIAERDSQPEESKDRLRFRYQNLDDSYWLLTSNGYKIVKKASLRKAHKA